MGQARDRGSIQDQDVSDRARAERALQKRVEEKRGKGYVDDGGVAPTKVPPATLAAAAGDDSPSVEVATHAALTGARDGLAEEHDDP